MWNLGWATVSQIYQELPDNFPVRSAKISLLLSQWEEAKLVLNKEINGVFRYFPAVSRSDALQFYLANLAALQWASTKNVPENAEVRESLIRKIAILNGIDLSESKNNDE